MAAMGVMMLVELAIIIVAVFQIAVRHCPECRKRVPSGARKCHRCESDLPPTLQPTISVPFVALLVLGLIMLAGTMLGIVAAGPPM